MHQCVAKKCDVEIPDDRLMCNRHWRKVPHDIQRAVWASYRPGQSAATASPAYMDAYEKAVAAVAAREGV